MPIKGTGNESDQRRVRYWIHRAGKIVGSQKLLAAACGCSQQAINLAKQKGRMSAEMALAIHWATDGVVPAWKVKPHIWMRPEHVPKKPLPPDLTPKFKHPTVVRGSS